jgi:hypothetical protein
MEQQKVVTGGESSTVPAPADVSGVVQPQPQSMFVDSDDLFTMGGCNESALCDAMCMIPPPDAEHATETDGEEGGSSAWEPHLWSF